MSKWYCYLNNETQGPFDEDELLALPDLVPSTKVCPEGGEEWEVVADMEELYRAYKSLRGKKTKRKVSVECAYHSGVLAVVTCKFCQKDLCESCAEKEDKHVICRDCQARRKDLLQQRADEKARLAEEKRLAKAKEAAARKRAKLIKRIIIAIVLIILVIGLAIGGKWGYDKYQSFQEYENTRTEIE